MKGFIRKCKDGLLMCLLFILLPVLLFTLQEKKNAHGKTNSADLGKKVYETRCLICHGAKGDGKGLIGVIRRSEKSGRIMEIHPRDFTKAVFRFRKTSTGCMPTDDDLRRTIENGIPVSFMPSYKEYLSSEEKEAVIEYIKTFSDWWEDIEPCEPIKVNKPEWIGSPASIEKGKKLYEEMKCWECHGHEGKGDGPKANELKTDSGTKILPFDFTTGTLKRGSSPENVYITFTTGLDGTPMPSYEDSLKEKDRWHLVSYMLKLLELKGRTK